MRYIDEFRSPDLLKGQLQKIKEFSSGISVMEVCGTHTMAISRSGLRPLLAPQVDLVSGPGCPVCVTAAEDIGRAISLAGLEGVVLTTFGDMMRVPGPQGTLSEAVSRGASVKVVYSPLEALRMAAEDARSKVVFLGVGFETTAPAVAACLLQAEQAGLDNFYVLSLHKLVPPALRALVEMEGFSIGGFLLPGHVSAVLGSRAYEFLSEEYGIPCVVAGFEAADILRSLYLLMKMKEEGPGVDIEYSRAVRPEGNPRAMAVMERVFTAVDAEWRGLGVIPGSGLELREEFRAHDAGAWEVEAPGPERDSGCRCGDILCGKIKPMQCPLFAHSCTPENPVGPCMVSTEGTCASYYLYDYREGEGLGG
ncbi:MAG: hydrogenase formation protein HypD [Actinobacteria bacterium]|jgi:hydrogenase expression/formation protein HypD|nr:MAG: hydrogenase formation protein HypD [Actinomycetota bacterium]